MSDRLRAELPSTHESTAPPALLAYQRQWIENDSQLKVAEKSRRIGLTWAEAADNTLTAASDGAAGGQNVYYIGYNQDMAIEYVEAVAMWARAFDYAAAEIEEGIWEDGQDDKHIKTFTVRFPQSGHRVVALSSRPANLRGKQGTVVIDEAAFHDRLDELLKAALALLIWGGQVRVISTHNGEQNPFNELLHEIRAGKRKGWVFRCTFQEAVDQGLYQRVCLRLGKEWTQAAQDEWVQEVYDFYGDSASEELDVIPSAGTGRFINRALAESVTRKDFELVRLSLEDEFVHWPQHMREAEVRDWCERELAPRIRELSPLLQTFVAEDFARSGDATDIIPGQQQENLDLHVPFIVELRNVPFEQQRQVFFYLVDRLPRFRAGALDAGGNGAYLAEVALQAYGASRIEEVKFSPEWYRMHMPRFKAAFEDATVALPAHADVINDVLAVRMDNGVAKVPQNTRYKGTDGRERHGDIAIALALLLYAAQVMNPAPIEFETTGEKRAGFDERLGADADFGFGVVGGRNDFGGYD